MKTVEITASELFSAGRWRVEIFTDDNSLNLVSRWPTVLISDIADESSMAANPSEYSAENICYVGLENVEPITGDTVDLALRNPAEIKSRSKIFRKGDVLYGRLRPYLRKVYLAEGAFSEGLCSTEFIVLRPKKGKVLPSVLRALLASEAISKQLARLQIGAALPRVSPSDFFRASVPLPPMGVQEEIAARIAALETERLSLKVRLVENPLEFDRVITELAFSHE